MTGTVRSQHWWQGILVRTLVAVIGIAMLTGGLSSMLITRSVGQHEQDQARQNLNELVDAVESTASIACFANDEQLAREVAQGLLKNGNVLRVVIRSGGTELARFERPSSAHNRSDFVSVLIGKLGIMATQTENLVARRLLSPFNRGEIVGDIMVDADWQSIAEHAHSSVIGLFLLLSAQIALVIAAIASTVLFFVVRPIKATSDGLHVLDPTSGMQLEVPPGHENTEIGRLVDDINDLSGRLVATLEQERTLQQMQAIAQRKYQDIFEHAASGIFLARRDGSLDSFNQAFLELTWMPNQRELTGRNLSEAGWNKSDRLLVLLGDSMDGANVVEEDFLLTGRYGDERWLHVAMMALGDGSVQGTVTDVTQRKLEEISARRLAVTDSLTGFANRAGLQKMLDGMLPEAAPFALIMLDLDGFKQINDSMGFPVGDQLILMVANRIRVCIEEGDGIARIGGDEFVIILSENADRASVSSCVDHLLEHIGRPYKLGDAAAGEEISIGASIGVALFPVDGEDLHQLLRSAELALNNARVAGGRAYRFFDPAMLAAIEHRRRLEDDLRHALPSGELRLAFQPIIDLEAGRMVGAEALLRWSHPVRGMVSPDVFIPLAEEIGLIGEIGKMVLAEACRHVAEWRAAGHELYVSVNVSVKQIPDELTPAEVVRNLDSFGLPPQAIAIEITEGVLMSDVTTAQSWIENLRAAGLRIYLDDFGTGYSSLSYLKRFPMDTVKIDKSFIRDMSEDSSDRTLVDAIITMARSLGLKVVAEGVETASQLGILKQLGCGYGQGYLFSRPVAGAEFMQVAAEINEKLAAETGSPVST